MVKFGLSQQQPIETLILVIRQSAGCSVWELFFQSPFVTLTQLIRERPKIVKTSVSHLAKWSWRSHWVCQGVSQKFSSLHARKRDIQGSGDQFTWSIRLRRRQKIRFQKNFGLCTSHESMETHAKTVMEARLLTELVWCRGFCCHQ